MLEGPSIDRNLAFTRSQKDASDRGFAAAGSQMLH
jgi:hypothetical protein